MKKHGTKKETFREKVDKLVKEDNKKRRLSRVKQENLKKELSEKGVSLRINKPIRVNLNINPSEYEDFIKISTELDPFFKIEGDPTKTQFYKDAVYLILNVVELVREKKQELDDADLKIKADRLKWSFKNV